MRISPFKEREKPQVYCWTDACSQNRHDGSSTKEMFIGMSGKKLEHGEIDKVSPWYWQSGKIDCVWRSPGSAEARAAIDAEDSMFMLRFQWSEILKNTANLHDIDSHVFKRLGVFSPIVETRMTGLLNLLLHQRVLRNALT